MAVMDHAKLEYGNRPSGLSTDADSLSANLRAVDERLRMACEAHSMVPAVVSTVDEDFSQLLNF